jgi:hypothetical protein
MNGEERISSAVFWDYFETFLSLIAYALRMGWVYVKRLSELVGKSIPGLRGNVTHSTGCDIWERCSEGSPIYKTTAYDV